MDNIGFEFVAPRSKEECDRDEMLKKQARVQRNISVHDDIEKDIETKLSNQPDLRDVLNSTKKISLTQLAGAEPGTNISKSDELVYVARELAKSAAAIGKDLCSLEGTFYIYTGKYFKKLSEEPILQFCYIGAYRIGIPYARSKNVNFAKELRDQLYHEVFFQEPTKDTSEVRINLNNGIINVKAGIVSVTPHDKKYFFRYCLHYDYDPLASAPIFQKYLIRVQPDEVIRMVIAEFLASVLIPNQVWKHEKIMYNYGFGENGKSVLLAIVKALFGEENCAEKSMSDLSDPSGVSVAALIGKLLNIAGESGIRLDTDRMKLLASGEAVQAKILYKDVVDLVNGCRHMMNCNKLPKDVEQTHGFHRRFLIVPWKETITKEEKITNLENQIIDHELPGVFNWLLEGLNRVMSTRKFTESEIIETANKEFKEDSDSVLAFINENNYRKSVSNSMAVRTLYQSYKSQIDEGSYPVSEKTFSQRVEQMGYKKIKTNTGKVFMIENTPVAPITNEMPF